MGKLEQQLALPRRGFYVDAPAEPVTRSENPPNNVTPSTNNVTRGRGQPKQYASAAERQRAYRARKAEA